MQYRAPRGTRDIFAEEVEKWQQLEETFRRFCKLYGYREIRTPLFEQTELFTRSVGEESDIVSKEMYTFQDRSGRSMTLRPEGTAPVVRAYLEHNMKEGPQPVKLYYIGPMFRYDRPQAGRYRQFHQVGLELFGAAGPAADAEIITLSLGFLKALHIEDFDLELNSVGCPQCRPAYCSKLLDYLQPLAENFCPDCRRRIAGNPLRVLDCRRSAAGAYAAGAAADGCLCSACDSHFRQLRKLLEGLHIPYLLNPAWCAASTTIRGPHLSLCRNAGPQGSLGGGATTTWWNPAAAPRCPAWAWPSGSSGSLPPRKAPPRRPLPPPGPRFTLP